MFRRREKVKDMKIILRLEEGKGKKLILVNIEKQSLIKKIAQLAGRGRNDEAMTLALAKGEALKEIKESDLATIGADIIINKGAVQYDLSIM